MLRINKEPTLSASLYSNQVEVAIHNLILEVWEVGQVDQQQMKFSFDCEEFNLLIRYQSSLRAREDYFKAFLSLILSLNKYSIFQIEYSLNHHFFKISPFQVIFHCHSLSKIRPVPIFHEDQAFISTFSMDCKTYHNGAQFIPKTFPVNPMTYQETVFEHEIQLGSEFLFEHIFVSYSNFYHTSPGPQQICHAQFCSISRLCPLFSFPFYNSIVNIYKFVKEC